MTQEEFEKIWLDGNDCVICHTSGSTGVPKTIRLPKEFMRESARRSNTFFGITADSRLHTCLDFEYIASKMMTVRKEVAKCILTSEKPSNRPLAYIGKDERIDLLSVVPSQLIWILDDSDLWKGIRHILVGGAPIHPRLRERIANSGYDVWESYGMTETASHIALRRVLCDDNEPFVTLPGITVSLSDSGCLSIGMPHMPEIVTNDIAEVYSPTEFRILGRADNCVISGGIKIIPEEVERLLGSFIKYDYCISSVPDKKWGERLVFVIKNDDPQSDIDVVKNVVKEKLASRCEILQLGVRSPKDVICVAEFPYAHNGKIDRRRLKSALYK